MVTGIGRKGGLCQGVDVLQAWQSAHPPDFNGVWSRPKVHAGFLRSWQANGLHRRVIARLKAIFESPGEASAGFLLTVICLHQV